MNSRLLHTIVTILLVIFATSAKADFLNYTTDRPLSFGIDRDYPPLEYIDENGDPNGLDIKFTQELMHRMNIPFTYSPNSWENIADDVLEGRVDLGMMVYSTYRKDITNYSKAVFRLYYQLVYPEDNKERMDVRNLKGKSVAYMASRPIKDTLTKVGAILYEVKDLSQAALDLTRGKYDAVLCFRYQSSYLINHYQLKGLITEDLTLAPREYCYVSHDKQLIDSINVELSAMQKEGIIDEIYGDVTSSFGGFKIPEWVWFLGISLVFVFLLLFIISQHIYQRRLKKEMIRAQQSEQLKSVFLGNISHALRTPLNAIIGFSDVLEADNGSMTNDDRNQLNHLININGKQLLYFINELLELSEFESKDIPFERNMVNLKEVMSSYLHECQHERVNGVELRLEGPEALVRLDEHYMRIVTKHFLKNAVKYTKHGSITLRYSFVDNGLQVEVQDTGEGLPDALKDNLFSLLSEKATFVQSEVPGLGLTICKAIVERNNGKIGARSPKEGGTVLWYWIPVKEVKHK